MDATQKQKLGDFKSVCFKLGFVMVIFFISRIVCRLLIEYILDKYDIHLTVNSEYIMMLTSTTLFLYIVPIVSAMFIFNRAQFALKNSRLYKKPPRLAKAVGNFPAIYGLGQITNLAALFIVWFLSNFSTGQQNLERSFGTMNSLMPPNLFCGVALFIHMVLVAAIFEEFMCRGIMLNALKPYGNGFAILATGFIFGIMHGNLQQFFYTFVLGVILAYITIQTGSLLTSTILHAAFNSVAAVMLLFMSTQTVQNYILPEEARIAAGIAPEKSMLVLAGFGMYCALFISLLIGGMALAVKRIGRMKNYKADNPFPEISAGKKVAVFLTSAPVVVMLLLVIDSFAGGLIAYNLYGLLWG